MATDKKPGRKRKLNEEQAEKIRFLYHKRGISMKDIAKRFGVSTPTVSKAISQEGCYE